MFALTLACSDPSEALAGGWTDTGLDSTTVSEQTGFTSTESSGDGDGDTMDLTDVTSAHTEGSETTASDGSEVSDDPTTMDSGWSACDGEVPVGCLIVAETQTCPGDPGGCEWYACQDERVAQARIDRAECLSRVCGVEPTHDLECLEGWLDLAADCFEGCDERLPAACSVLHDGAWMECHL